MATAEPSTSNVAKKEFNPKFPAADLVDAIHKDAEKAQRETLERLANLAVPVAGKTAESGAIDATIDQVLSHGETTKFFGELFSLSHKGILTREEVDQRLVNWVLKTPGMMEKYEVLPDNLKSDIDQFKDHDLTQEFIPTSGGAKFRPNPIIERRSAQVKAKWEEQVRLDKGEKYPDVLENDGSRVMYVEKMLFENWGETVKNTPAITFIPKSVVGVQNIVKYAKGIDKKIRVSGFRHSYSDLFSNEDEILISLLPLDLAIDLPYIEGAFASGEGLLQLIELVPGSMSADGETIDCKIGTATTNDQFRDWCLSEHGGAEKWTTPSNVFMVETTVGGSTSGMCHGAGITHKTLSDLVVEVEYVDANGNLRTVSDKNLLKAASGALGLLGVVTAYTIRLNKMTYAAMRPARVPIELAIPPPPEYITAARNGDPKYKWIKDLVAQHSQETIDKAVNDFIRSAENDYYAEWYWWPLQREAWINTWNNDGNKADSKTLPSKLEGFLEWLEEWIAEVLNHWTVWQALPGEVQTKLLAFLALAQSPNITDNEPSLTTQLISALYVLRGIQNMQVYNMEWQIPIPPQSAQGEVKRDWSITQRAWWDAILMMEAEPSMVRTALEMRVMGGSDVLLAAQRGNDLGTACIDIVTTLLTPIDDWADFCQRITDKWISYKDPSTGKRLRARPHWCKQWSYLTLPDDQGLPLKAIDWFRKVGYKDEIPQFMDALKTIGQDADFTVDDLRARFANQHLESIFWGAPDPIEVLVRPDDISSGVINKIKKWIRGCFS